MNTLIQKVLIATLATSTAMSFCIPQSSAASSKGEKAEKGSTTSKGGKDAKVDLPVQYEPSTTLTLKDMSNVEALNHYMTFYYLHPQPELLVATLLLADKLGLLQGEAATPLQAFASRIMAANPDKVKGMYADLAPISDNGKTLILTSLWWSNTKEAKEILEQIASQLPEKPKAEFKKQIDNAPPEVDKMAADSPAVLDMLWACFCATGDEKYVKRLVTVLATTKVDTKDLSQVMILNTGRWSLLSNIDQHERVKQICESLKGDSTLGEYVAKALAETAAKKADTASAADKESAAKNAAVATEGTSAKDASSKDTPSKDAVSSRENATASVPADNNESAAGSDKKKKNKKSKEKKVSLDQKPPVDLQMKVEATAVSPPETKTPETKNPETPADSQVAGSGSQPK